MPPKVIIITGGVLSGLGKGIAAASIGFLLGESLKIVPIKCDGYLNVDPGTMNPIEHGEVFVLEDGGEVDMDFGHYERFMGITCKSQWNLTMGQVFNEIRIKERRGDFLGQTVEYIPHVVEHIKKRYLDTAKEEKADVVIIEIGGTVGQIENDLYIEACRQLRKDIGDENIMYVHVTYVPIPTNVNEQKSKPTQQSVQRLRERGIQPDMIIGRCEEYLTPKIKKKISIFCDVEEEAVITGLDVDSVYKIPIVFDDEGVGRIVSKILDVKRRNGNVAEWKKLIENWENAKRTITIAMCGKYTDLEDSYASINEALMHCGAHLNAKVKIKFIETTHTDKVASQLEGVDGVIVPGGFGGRGIEGKIEAVKVCREKNVPFLGLCYGLQMAVIEFARNVCGLEGANTTEVDNKTKHPVIAILEEQKDITTKGATMRLGAYPAKIEKGTKVHALYKSDNVSERHRHRYEVNPKYHKILSDKGLVFSGMSPDRKLVEFIELPDHKYFIGTQAHPELKSSLPKPAPLFYGFIKACLEK